MQKCEESRKQKIRTQTQMPVSYTHLDVYKRQVRQFRKQDLIIHMQRRLGVGKFHRAVGAQHAELHSH